MASPEYIVPLGHIVATPGALERVPMARILEAVERHEKGDWGCVDPEDAHANDTALKDGTRLLSAYAIDEAKPCRGYGENTLWVITEADRSVTTVLLPEEY